MKKEQTIALGVLVLAGVGGYVLFGQDQSGSQTIQAPQTNTETSVQEPQSISEQADPDVETGETEGAAVVYTNSVYSPDTLTVEAGTTVTFTNESRSPMWTASDVHPVHTEYPDSGITKCGTSEEASIFDACRGIETGSSYSFQFNEIGTWEYHDHLNPFRGGTIVVE